MMPVLINDVPLECINHAAITYHVPALVILSVIKQEGGRNGLAVRNKNGSFDLGVMQINTSWLSILAPYGYSRNDLQFDPCKNITVGAWILAKGLAEGKTLWSGVGNYHSHTPIHNKSYRNNIYVTYQKINNVIFS